jgi:DNA mismatch repair ATPase MutS
MSFRIDNQTVSDIELFSQNEKTPSLFGFYNRTVTIGGQERFYRIVRTPISDIKYLEDRKREIEYFIKLKDHIKLNKRQLDYVEYYLKNRRNPLKNNLIDATRDSIAYKLKSNNDYYTIREGIINLSRVLADLRLFLLKLQSTRIPESLNNNLKSAFDFVDSDFVSGFIQNLPKNSKDIKPKIINRFDDLFRSKKANELREVLDTIYEIDVLQSLSDLVISQGFCLPKYVKSKHPIFEIEDCFHPLIKDPQPNSFKFNQDNSLCFITGPNMSGKSTFLKSVAILVYFSHVGLPVPAKKLRTTVFQGLFTTINLSDKISQGFSHFYAEVNRVKEMALSLQDNNNFVVILDELFRGTNVKDAFEGTLLVVKALSKIKGAFFFISSHILEVAEQLYNSDKIDFKCFESILNKDTPVYDYNLKKGISTERVGLQIIKNENIEKILIDIISKQDN